MITSILKKSTLALFCLPMFLLNADSPSPWQDIKDGTRRIIRGAAKGVKKGATRVSDKIEKNVEEDEREEAEERKQEKEKSKD